VIIQDGLSRQYVRVLVTATTAGAPYNPTGDAVEFAFTIPGGVPSDGDWQPGSWDSTEPLPDGSYVAQCLVGPGGTTTLPAGVYTIRVRVTDNPETPVLTAGQLKIQ